ncbi:hypothetical protein [Leifsonia sp. SIMBA_070]|uniref:hypothetical protein n=2 Tax=Bacillati TaxID=1783272 RepID=UPI00397ABE46
MADSEVPFRRHVEGFHLESAVKAARLSDSHRSFGAALSSGRHAEIVPLDPVTLVPPTDDCSTVGYSIDVDNHATVVWASGRRPDRWYVSRQREREVFEVVETAARTWRGGALFVQPLLGGFVIATSDCEWRSSGADRNAVIIDDHGHEIVADTIGGGIRHLQATSTGEIWVGYSDEGVYGNYGWNHPGPETPGCWGIARFDTSLTKVWDYAPRSLQDPDAPEDVISECYALNVTDDRAIACTYTDFPIVQIDRGGDVTVHRVGMEGADNILVSGQVCALFGGYGGDQDRVAIGELHEGGFDERGAGKLQLDRLPEGDLGPVFVSRGSQLNRLSDRSWLRWRLEVKPKP